MESMKYKLARILGRILATMSAMSVLAVIFDASTNSAEGASSYGIVLAFTLITGRYSWMLFRWLSRRQQYLEL